MFMVLENFRDFEKDDFPTDEVGGNIRCDGCKDVTEQYLIIESKTYCKGCLERGIQMLNKNFMQHCKDSWNKRVREENAGV
jgi:hypothetical protein